MPVSGRFDAKVYKSIHEQKIEIAAKTLWPPNTVLYTIVLYKLITAEAIATT